MYFEIVGELRDARTIAVGRAIRELARLQKTYGKGRWRKRKATVSVRLSGAELRDAEVHWYEATGIGKKEFKINRFVD